MSENKKDDEAIAWLALGAAVIAAIVWLIATVVDLLIGVLFTAVNLLIAVIFVGPFSLLHSIIGAVLYGLFLVRSMIFICAVHRSDQDFSARQRAFAAQTYVGVPLFAAWLISASALVSGGCLVNSLAPTDSATQDIAVVAFLLIAPTGAMLLHAGVVWPLLHETAFAEYPPILRWAYVMAATIVALLIGGLVMSTVASDWLATGLEELPFSFPIPPPYIKY